MFHFATFYSFRFLSVIKCSVFNGVVCSELLHSIQNQHSKLFKSNKVSENSSLNSNIATQTECPIIHSNDFHLSQSKCSAEKLTQTIFNLIYQTDRIFRPFTAIQTSTIVARNVLVVFGFCKCLLNSHSVSKRTAMHTVTCFFNLPPS